jgi:hypothetical protein
MSEQQPNSAAVAGIDRSHRRPVVLRPLPFITGAAIDAEHILSDREANKLTDALRQHDANQRAANGGL